jgi:hypothetical protein
MPLINQVFAVCRKLVGKGWDVLLKTAYGLDIDQPDAASLQAELAKSVTRKKLFAGFEDFADTDIAGVTPGSPSHSLLYHALASPNVLNDVDGNRLGVFPTPADIEAVENYVFAAKKATLATLLHETRADQLTVVVFAHEYRPASQTCHRKHADMVYARTGIARVGTEAANYKPEWRGFTPESSADAHAICVSPSRFAAYLAVRKNGDPAAFIPMHRQKGDEDESFWVPVHKLFDGGECLTGLNLTVNLTATHVNEKIFRIHKFILKEKNPPGGPPYRVTEGIAAFSDRREHGTGLVLPEVHAALVAEVTQANGAPLTFKVPGGTTTFSTFEFKHGSAPAYVHIRTEVRGGQQFDLNDLDEAALMKKLNAGGYQAQHYADFTGEGWVSADCPALNGKPQVAAKSVAAYSLVSAPDFFPSCDQRELTEWTASNATPKSIRRQIWNIPPDTLCDLRLPPNLQLDGKPFDAADVTATAIVPLLAPVPTGADVQAPAALRHSHLPDDAAGYFAPGWDVSSDTLPGTNTQHLAGYALGSPFPEDAKLCAALSTFWAAVAPDATREMEPTTGNQSGTVAPLTDQEVGQVGDLAWDGVPGPQVVQADGQEFAEYASFQHVDYVRNALANKFSARLTARVDAREYENRVLAAAFAYLVLGAERTGDTTNPVPLKAERRLWKMLSFLAVTPGSPELAQAQQDTHTLLPGDVYRCVFFPAAPVKPAPDHRKKRLAVGTRFFLLVDPANRLVLVRGQSQTAWRKGTLLLT